MSRSTSKNRLMGNRLWDDAGREWSRTKERPAFSDLIAAVDRGTRCVVYGDSSQMNWLEGEPARAWLTSRKEAVGCSDQFATVRDGDGLLYEVRVWTRDGGQLVAFQAFT